MEGIKTSREKANAIIEQANQRKDALLMNVHREATESIRGMKESNQKQLQELQETLQIENEKKIKEHGRSRLPEVTDLLFNIVVNIPDE